MRLRAILTIVHFYVAHVSANGIIMMLWLYQPKHVEMQLEPTNGVLELGIHAHYVWLHLFKGNAAEKFFVCHS